ncbi:hypothetical protein GR223_11400 [Rhizobium leguminosarum]|uniref:hypothetical protein n=1 Tax=Rhizobium ruizarguesonis TaxID=2081791 RepID=UPI0013E0B545|nr:hypothetical protein [Rhizobium ruizarguesonis]NEJ86541.1 hypothetical protein [Rhizobium ruizarguesonis]
MKALQDLTLQALSDFLEPSRGVSILTWDYWTSESGLTVASTLLAAVLGAVFGTVGSAAISWSIANRTAAEQIRRDEVARLERDKAVALQAFVKIFTITNQIYSILGLSLQMLESAEQNGAGNLDLWQRLLPMAGVTENPDRFDAQEAALLIGAEEFDVATDLLLTAEKYASLTASINRYSERRLRLTDLLSTEIAASGLGTMKLTKEQYQKFAGQMYELNDMATQICEALPEDFEFSKAAAEKVGPAFRRILRDRNFPLAIFPPEGSARSAAFRKFFK